MQQTVYFLTLLELALPLLGSLIAGILGKALGPTGAHRVTIFLMSLSLLAAILVTKLVFVNHQTEEAVLYTWAVSGHFQFDVGFLIDHLSALMMLMVCFVSWVVHIYSVGYMKDDPGYQRFFSYVSLFTFMMLLLVSANNFFQLFLGWEGVGLVSYLLIGFWFHKESAAAGSLKAFIVNRIGDLGFILAMAAILDTFSSLNYATVFAHASYFSTNMISLGGHTSWHLLTVICILLFIGAMGKSAQVPLHVWLPESMEGPTPISALIHAATMVTAGVYLVARMSPLFLCSPTALSLVLIVGATGALFLGLLAFVENDIKRVVAYSTMSQLGYMMAANGVGAFSAGIFHLLMHGCFKALLFLAAGSVIVALHHEQDLRKMGGLWRFMPVTYVTFLIGALALAAIPPFSGYYSKDAIIEAVHLSQMPGAHYAYFCLILGSFVTSYYIFRAFFMAFHGRSRLAPEALEKVRESTYTMTIPLVLLAIASVSLGFLLVNPALYQMPGLFGGLFKALPWHPVSIWDSLPVWISLLGIVVAYVNVLVFPSIPAFLQKRLALLFIILKGQYGFDHFNELVWVRGTRVMSRFFYRILDVKCLDHYLVDGVGRCIRQVSVWVRRLQTGYLYHYVLIMMLGLLVFLVRLMVY